MSDNIKVICDRSDIVAVADAVRSQTGTTAEMSLSEIESGIYAIKTVPNLQEKTVAPTTSEQTISPDDGYDGLSEVTVSAMPTATQATPFISVSSGGLITASATQSAGYVSAGTKSATKQLTTQTAKTITPTKSAQTAVASGSYTTGAVTVAAIPAKYPDVSSDTVTADVLLKGYTSHDKNGNPITGTYEPPAAEDLTSLLDAQETKLNTLLTTLDNKAAGGSGGASVETCTVTIILDLSPLSPTDPMVIYTDANMTVVNTTGEGVYQVVKNSMVVVEYGDTASCSGYAERILSGTHYGTSKQTTVIMVTGECQINIS